MRLLEQLDPESRDQLRLEDDPERDQPSDRGGGQGVQAARPASENKVPQTAKEKLESACSEAAEGNTGAVKKVAREVCEEVVAKAPLPSSAREVAIANCRK